mmetsp:Transcript_31988/g.52822  ORF Transcript_31988/g.52822 Transcript_31988/m.52822 type:complete len:165 (+) Transcript_31988:91-585(+)|eukprot:CAMPEP_0119013194 /NCGR_PEP_ID=MMETSP1176-20130426/8126_1 /TAXON_ID=265551 /ORGANISM="Synedropsis recta cf, Strain CCMP1620" /LENGTH=164 /DNA_ID=CAMNT_0006966255 /DNA_START=91 /DNA_END=585 /DNA_ORIENTATION=-
MPCFHREPPTMNENQQKILKEMEAIATNMDRTFVTVCGKDIGYDGIIGLIPVVGDIFTSFVSLWIVMRAWFAFDKWLFRRKWCIMLVNVGIDLCIGAIPFFGDLFDVYWKSNIMNVNLVRKHYGIEPMQDNQEVSPEQAVKNGKSGNSARSRGVVIEEDPGGQP